MQLHPEMRALLNDPACLRAQQAVHADAFAAWRRAPQGRALFEGSGSARTLTAGLARPLIAALAAAPFGQVPLRHSATRAATTVLLARENEASLTLVALDEAGLALQPPAPTAAFVAAEEWDVVLAGHGAGRLIEYRGAQGLLSHALALKPGVALGRDAAREALLVERAEGSLLLLRLRRALRGPGTVREFAIATGEMVHQSAATARESRSEIAVALLGRMGRKDATPVLADLAGNTGRSDMLRWQALRECLALDTLRGFRTLDALARRAGDPLARAAGALRAQLIEQHPVLRELASCPA